VCFFCSNVSASDEAAYKKNEQGLIKLKAKDYKGAVADFKDAHRHSPYNKSILYNLGAAYNNYGFLLLQKSELELAVEQFEKAYYYDSKNVYTLYNLGQAYYRLQDLAKAREYLRKAYAIDPKTKGLKKLLEKTEKEIATESSFRQLQSSHFIIAASEDISPENISRLKSYLEDAYHRVGMLLDYYPRINTVAVLYSERDYDKLLKNRPHWTLGIFDGKVRIPVSKGKYTYEDMAKILYHEYAHAVVYCMVKNNCPLWLNEGIASMAEELVMVKDKSLFRRYVDTIGFIPLAKLPDSISSIKDHKIAALMYMEFHTLADFIVKRKGREGLKKILSILSKGRNIDYAIIRTFSLDPAEFEKAWIVFLKQEYGINI